jgi:hypothetical protein
MLTFLVKAAYSITNLMKDILEPFKNKISTIEIVTVAKINKNDYERFKRDFSNYDIRVFKSDDFHDRFWIIDDSKDYLTQKDTDELLSLYKKEELS